MKSRAPELNPIVLKAGGLQTVSNILVDANLWLDVALLSFLVKALITVLRNEIVEMV